MRVPAICNFYHTVAVQWISVVIYLFKMLVRPSSLLRPESYSLNPCHYRYTYRLFPRKKNLIRPTPLFRVMERITVADHWISELTGGRGRILGVRGLVWCPFTQTYVFVLRVKSKMNIVYISCLLQWKYINMRVCKYKLPQKIKLEGGGGGKGQPKILV